MPFYPFFLLPVFAAAPARAGSFDCTVVYDEFDSLMNKNFLQNHEAYVQVKQGRQSRDENNGQQKDKLMLRPDRKDMGVTNVKTNKNTWGKFLYT